MSKHDVYELVPAPKGRKIIGSMWVFKVNLTVFTSHGSVHKVFSGSRNRLWKHIRSGLSHSKCPHCVGYCCQPRLECDSARCTDSISSERDGGRGIRETTRRFRKTRPERTTVCVQAKEELVLIQTITPQLAWNYPPRTYRRRIQGLHV